MSGCATGGTAGASAPVRGEVDAGVDRSDTANANRYDLARSDAYRERAADWRVGAVVYQVIVDRFGPPADLESKRDLYEAPKRLRSWDEDPVGGTYLQEAGVWSHEVDFWGGDLDSLRERLDYVRDLGVDVVYLNPVKDALTNHKYDASDYLTVSAEYGDRGDVRDLAGALHERGMKLMLDGVFNHVGRNSDKFESAMADEDSPYRDWFYIDERYPKGYRSWYNVANLPELNLENAEVREFLWEGDDSVVRTFLEDGVDGWRLDVAYDLGFNYLGALTEAAHETRPGSWVVGEVWTYPEEWVPALDGVMNFHARALIFEAVFGNVSGPRAGRMFETMVDDMGIEGALRSWLILDNHDTSRLRHMIPGERRRRMAQALQFTLPGAPVVYYGTEIGQDGGHDPESRGPFRWSWLGEDSPVTEEPAAELKERAARELAWVKHLIELRVEHPALRIGDMRGLETERLLAFMRRTDRRDETVIVAVNPTDEDVRETVQIRDSKQMGYGAFVDVLPVEGEGREFRPHSGLLTIEVPARGAVVLVPRKMEPWKYSPFKRMQ